MKRKIYLLGTLLLLSMVASASMPFSRMRRAQKAEPAVVYTLEAVKSTYATYASYTDVTVNNMTWNAPGNQSLGAFWRLGGGKNAAMDNEARYITGKTPMNGIISSIVIYHNGVNNAKATVNSVSVTVASDANFVNVVDEVIVANPSAQKGVADSIVIRPTEGTWPLGSYYKLTFRISASMGSNVGLDFTSAVFWGEAGAEPLPFTPVTVRLNPASVKALGWEQVGLWAWVSNNGVETNLFSTWPGTSVSIDEETGWYSYTFSNEFEGNLNIIWNDGIGSGNAYQTVDIAVNGSTCYEVSTLKDSYGKRTCNSVDCPDAVNPNEPTIHAGQAKVIGDSLAVGAKTDTTYNIVGYVTSIKENAFASNGNMIFYIDDVLGGEYRFYVYRGKPSVELHVGDKVSVKSKVYNYNGIIETESYMPVTLLEAAVNTPLEDGIYDFASIGYNFSDWAVDNATLNEAQSTTSKYVYDIKQNSTGVAYVQSVPNIRFQICNESADKEKAFNFSPGKYYEFGGKQGVIVLRNTEAGQKIILSVAAKGGSDASLLDPDGKYPLNAVTVTEDLTLPARDKETSSPDADSQGYFWKNIEYVSTGGDVRIKEFNAGFRVRSISIAKGEEIDTTQVLTVAKATEFCKTLPASQSTSNSIAVAGYVVKANEYDMTLNCQTFFIADDPTDTLNVFQAYRATPVKYNEAYPVLPGDYVILRGPLQRYVNSSTNEQIMESFAPTVEFLMEVEGDRSLPEVRVFTVAQALQRGYKMTVNHYSIATYDIQGYISAIAEDGYDQYSNMSFWMADEANNAASNAEGAFYVYRGKVTEKLQLGDFINIRTHVQNIATNNGTDSIIESIAGAKVTLLKRETDTVPPSDIPTEAVLANAGYDLINNVVLCIKPTQEAEVCNTIVLAGAYNGWDKDNLDSMLRFAPLEGYEGWYVVQYPYNSSDNQYANQSKPVQLMNDGSFVWDYQSGDINAWVHKGGLSTEFEYYDISGQCTPYFNAPGAYIYQLNYWLNHASPCNVTPAQPETIYVNCTYPMAKTYYESSKDWYLSASDAKYWVTMDFYSNNAQSPAGTYSGDDFDYNYTKIRDASTEDVLSDVTAATAQVIESADSIVVYATLTGKDGNTYQVYMFTPKPKATSYVDVIASNMAITNHGNGWYQIDASDNNTSVTFQLYTDVIPGTYEMGEKLFTRIIDAAGEQSVYDATISITLSDSIYTLTGNALCLNNTLYSFYLRSPKQENPDTIAPSDIPTEAVLANAGYDLINNVVLCIKPTQEAEVCNTILLAGAYNGWDKDNLDSMLRFTPLQGYEGWYVVQYPYSSESQWANQSKPVQLKNDGTFSWDYQSGDINAWVYKGGLSTDFEYVEGSDQCTPYFNAPGAYIYQLNYWLNHMTPCHEESYIYTIGMYAPDACPEMKPAIIGDFNNWAERIPMLEVTGDKGTYYYYSFKDMPGHSVSFTAVGDKDWNNSLQYYNAEYDAWYNASVKLTKDTFPFFDLRDNTLYRFAQCVPSTPDTLAPSVVPTAAVLADAGYDLINNVVLCVYFTGEAKVCNDIYFVGSFSNWETSFSGCPKFAPLNGYEGWYVAEAPYTGNFQGKPIQAKADGSFSWENQCGDPNAWKWLAGNSIYLEYGASGEANMYYYSAGAYIYQMSYWKNHADLCEEELAEKVFVFLKAPKNTPQEGVDIVGTFDNWNGTKMDTTGNNTYSALIKATSSDVFKFRKAGDTEWNDQIVYWNEEYQEWSNLPNLSISAYWFDGDSLGLSGYKIIDLNYSDSATYRWTSDIPVAPDTTAIDPICYYMLDLTDSYGDGWNNAYLTVKDGSKEMNFTLYSGSYERAYVPYYGNEVSFIWNTGNYDGEVGFTVLAANGIGIFHHVAGTSIENGELLYTMKTSPCVDDLNPYIPQNVKAGVTDEYKLRVTWDAVAGAASYGLFIYNPQGVEISNGAKVTGTTYLSAVLRMNGEYQIRVISYDATGLQLGDNNITTDVYVPSIPSVTIQAFAPTDCNMDVKDGLWLVWNVSGDTLLHVDSMTTTDGKLFVATFAPNAPSYDYSVINKPSLNADSVTRTYGWTNRTESEHCSEIMYARSGNWHGLQMFGQCEFKDHNYEISNMQAQSYPGRVEFSWEAQDVEDKYYLYIWDTDWQTQLDTIVVNNATTYTWAVDDKYDGMTVGWSVYPAEPYSHSHKGAGTINLQKGAIENIYATASTQDNKTLDMAWAFSTDELHYLVEIMYGTIVVKREIVTAKEYHYTAPLPVYYNAYVTPLNMSNEVLGAQVFAGSVNLSDAPAAVKDIKSVVEGKHITFTWNTDAPKVRARLNLTLSNGDAKFISQQDVTAKTLSFDVEEDGTYTLYLAPYVESEPAKYVFPDYWYNGSAQVFTSKTYHVEINVTEGGYLNPANASGDYAEGTLNVWAYSYAGYYFDGWSNGVKENKLSLYVDQNISVTAIFKPYFKLTLNESEGGTIGINVEQFITTDSAYILLKQNVTYILTAFPNEGYEFVQWSDGKKSISRQEVMTQDAEFTAIFKLADPAKEQYYVHVFADNEKQGTVTPYDQLITEGTTIEIAATPAEGYDFVCWSDSVPTNPRQIVVQKPVELYAIFAPKKVSLKLEAGVGGTVNSEINGIYEYGDEVVVKAVANERYHFLSWSDGIRFAERTVKLTKDTVLKATFEQDTYFTLDVRAGNGGKIRATGKDEWSNAYTSYFDPSKRVTIEAKADEGYLFEQWSDGVTDSVRSFYLTKDTSLTALFVPVYKLTVMATAGGAVEVEGDYTLMGQNIYLFAAGEKATLTAKPNEGYMFSGWENNDKSRVREIIMTENKTVIAKFQEASTTPQRTVTIGVEGEGQGTVTAVEPKYYQGESFTVMALPENGSKFVEWSDGVKDNPRIVEVADKDIAFNAVFALATYKLTIGVEGIGGTVNDSVNAKEYKYGEAVIIEAKADSNYHFLKWSDGDMNAYRRIVITQDTVLKASFEGNLFTITFINYNDSVIESKQWAYGTIPSCSVTPTRPNEGNKAFVFSGWEPKIAAVTGDASYKATYTTEILAYTVTFYDYDWSEIEVQQVKPGEAAVMPADPVRKGYEFTGWKVDGGTLADLKNVQSDLDVIATYKKAEQGLDGVEDGTQATKIYRNGQIYILRGDKIYTLQGQEVAQ